MRSNALLKRIQEMEKFSFKFKIKLLFLICIHFSIMLEMIIIKSLILSEHEEIIFGFSTKIGVERKLLIILTCQNQ